MVIRICHIDIIIGVNMYVSSYTQQGGGTIGSDCGSFLQNFPSKTYIKKKRKKIFEFDSFQCHQ